MKTITNLENALKFAVNIYEIENSILNGDTSYKTHDATFFFMETPTVKNYKVNDDEVLLNTNEGTTVIVKKV
jgi:hypothetical protein